MENNEVKELQKKIKTVLADIKFISFMLSAFILMTLIVTSGIFK